MPRGRGIRGRSWLAVLLLPVATVAVHQLRYLLAYGSRAGRELADQGDSYVGSLIPVLVVLLALSLGVVIVSLTRAAFTSRLGDSTRPVRLAVLWGAASAAVLIGYVAQEALEVLAGSAHVGILSQAFGDGGWWALPASVAVGLAWALVARGTRVVLDAAGQTRSRWRARLPGRGVPPRPAPSVPALSPPSCPLSRRLAGRAPPLVSSR